jgi:hypothetical protein
MRARSGDRPILSYGATRTADRSRGRSPCGAVRLPCPGRTHPTLSHGGRSTGSVWRPIAPPGDLARRARSWPATAPRRAPPQTGSGRGGSERRAGQPPGADRPRRARCRRSLTRCISQTPLIGLARAQHVGRRACPNGDGRGRSTPSIANRGSLVEGPRRGARVEHEQTSRTQVRTRTPWHAPRSPRNAPRKTPRTPSGGDVGVAPGGHRRDGGWLRERTCPDATTSNATSLSCGDWPCGCNAQGLEPTHVGPSPVHSAHRRLLNDPDPPGHAPALLPTLPAGHGPTAGRALVG